MRKLSVLALVLLAGWTADVGAVEFKNVRATYGPFGATRPDNKMLPGDIYMLNFDITGLKVDPKTGAANYTITIEVFDSKGKQQIDDKDKTAEKGVLLGFGGGSAPDYGIVMLGIDKAAGKYKVVVTVVDKGAKSPKQQLVHEIDLLPAGFGILHIGAPAFGVVGQGFIAPNYELGFSVAGYARDAKKSPKITVTVLVLDEAGKQTTTDPMASYRIPDDLPAAAAADQAKRELLPLSTPLSLNRAGKFTVIVEARDELSKKSAKLSYTLTVVDSAK